MSVPHWEAYYRGGSIAACQTGPDNYTLELREVWNEFFSSLATGSRILDLGTGNGAIPLIAKAQAEMLGRTFEIHGADLARIDPIRHVPRGAELFAGITFHATVAAERLPFAAASFAAVTGQYALEYTDVPRTLAEVSRVLQVGCATQFVIHHAQSIVVEIARVALQHADLVLNQTNVYRRLRKFLEAEQRAPALAKPAADKLSAAMAILRQTAEGEHHNRVLAVTLDAVPKLLGLRHRLSQPALGREIDGLETGLRHSVRRHRELLTAAATEATMAAIAECARTQGFSEVSYKPLLHAQSTLVGWHLQMVKARD